MLSEKLLSCIQLPFIISRTSKNAVEEQKQLESQLAEEVEVAKGRIAEIQQELESIVDQLGQANVCNISVLGIFKWYGQR